MSDKRQKNQLTSKLSDMLGTQKMGWRENASPA
jgi:hypothetical protein